MKKLLAFLLCMTLMLGAVASATEMTSESLEGQTTVSLKIVPEANQFTVVIPAVAEIDPETQKYEGQIVLKAGWKFPACNGLTVKLKSSLNFSAGKTDVYLSNGIYWLMKNEDGYSARYAIHVKPHGDTSWHMLDAYYKSGQSYGSYFWTRYDLINVTRSSDNTQDTVCDIRFKVPTLPTEVGEYTDVLTFVVTLK